jgi:putative SOS response-associated peptidase YedK
LIYTFFVGISMCGRFALSAKTSSIEALVPGLHIHEDLEPRYNIAPTQNIAAVTGADPTVPAHLRWGLIPSWAKDKNIAVKMINARAETLGEKPAFRNLLKRRRCLIFADGYYEWRKYEGQKRKIPFYFKMKSGEPFTFAGLWDVWKNNEQGLFDDFEDGTAPVISSATNITTSPNELTSKFHNRMPAIILPTDRELWLSDEEDINYISESLRPYPEEEMETYEVSSIVNNAFNDNAACTVPFNTI